MGVPCEVPDVDEPVQGLLRDAGIGARRLRAVIAALTERPHTLASLIRESAVERRTVERLLAALGADLLRTGNDEMRIAPGRVGFYRTLVDDPPGTGAQPVDPLAHLMARQAPLIATVSTWMAQLPGPRPALDHVSATAETAVRRAVWLDSTFDLDGARLLCLGDHDLTSLTVAAVNPKVEVTVVDVDDLVLAFIDGIGAPSVRCLWSDVRLGLASGAREWADLVFTDPPYTPDGVRLFLARGLEGLRERTHSRLVLSYGFSAGQPALALKVQQAVADLHLVYEAVLPAFNRYYGAQAVGSASNLYVLRPTARSGPARGPIPVNLYTRGVQALEAGPPGATAEEAAALRAAAGSGGLEVAMVGDRRWPVADVLAGRRAGHRQALAVDLSDDPGGWLARVLLALDAPRLAVLVPNNHPDLASAAAQRALTELVAAKWRLRLRRSTPGPHRAIVEADRVDATGLSGADQAVRAVLDRAHGTVSNTWREGLIRAGGGALTKNAARALVRDHSPGAIGEQLVDLPRHRLAAVPVAIAASVVASHPVNGVGR